MLDSLFVLQFLLPTKLIKCKSRNSVMSSSYNLRSSNTEYTLLGKCVEPKHGKITGSKLPTEKQILISYIAFRKKIRNEDKSKQNQISMKAKHLVLAEIKKTLFKFGDYNENQKVCVF